MAVNPPHSDTATAEKLALTLAGSLILHFALIFGLQIRAVSTANQPARVIEARLVEAPGPVTAPQPAPTQVPEQEAPELQAAELIPPPPPATSTPPTPVQPASAAAPENSADLPSIEIPLIEDPTYYPAQEVDVHPTALQAIQPHYPDEAASANATGSVVLVLLLDEGGKVRDISVEEANPPGMFDKSALDAFRNARFAPAQRHGRTVKSRMRIKITYDLTDKKDSVDKTKQK
jgi:protein TonB